MNMNYEKGSGQILCNHCKKGISGEAIIGYKYEDDYVEDHTIIHKNCLKSFQANKIGLAHECPKCKGSGSYGSSLGAVIASPPYGKPDLRTAAEVIADETKCKLCEGHGYLAKPPIPVITDWKKAE